MSTPLESFMETLQKSDVKNKTHFTTTFVAADCSIPAHTHTSAGFSNLDKGMKCEEKCEDPLTLPTDKPVDLSNPPQFRTGQRVIYQTPVDAEPRKAVVLIGSDNWQLVQLQNQDTTILWVNPGFLKHMESAS